MLMVCGGDALCPGFFCFWFLAFFPMTLPFFLCLWFVVEMFFVQVENGDHSLSITLPGTVIIKHHSMPT